MSLQPVLLWCCLHIFLELVMLCVDLLLCIHRNMETGTWKEQEGHPLSALLPIDNFRSHLQGHRRTFLFVPRGPAARELSSMCYSDPEEFPVCLLGSLYMCVIVKPSLCVFFFPFVWAVF